MKAIYFLVQILHYLQQLTCLKTIVCFSVNVQQYTKLYPKYMAVQPTMKLCTIIFVCCLVSVAALGQVTTPDSSDHLLTHPKFPTNSGDKIDSIQSAFYQQSDSIKQAYKSKFSKMD